MQVNHPNKHIRQAVRYAARKGWRVTKAGPRAHIWGGHYGVLGKPVKAAAFGFYQHREIRRGMHASSATMLIAVLISEEGNWGA